jgi:hypothetical protein
VLCSKASHGNAASEAVFEVAKPCPTTTSHSTLDDEFAGKKTRGHVLALATLSANLAESWPRITNARLGRLYRFWAGHAGLLERRRRPMSLVLRHLAGETTKVLLTIAMPFLLQRESVPVGDVFLAGG